MFYTDKPKSYLPETIVLENLSVLNRSLLFLEVAVFKFLFCTEGTTRIFRKLSFRKKIRSKSFSGYFYFAVYILQIHAN